MIFDCSFTDIQISSYLFISMLEDRQENESATQLAPSVLQYLHDHY